MAYKIRKIAEQLANEYHQLGQKGPEFGGDADQESEVPEELNEEMEAREMEGFTPGNDNLVVDKTAVLAELEKIMKLTKTLWGRELIRVAMLRLRYAR